MKVKKVDTILSGESMTELWEMIREAEKWHGSFLLQVFSSKYAVGLFIPPELVDEVKEFINKLKCNDDEREGEDHE